MRVTKFKVGDVVTLKEGKVEMVITPSSFSKCYNFNLFVTKRYYRNI